MFIVSVQNDIGGAAEIFQGQATQQECLRNQSQVSNRLSKNFNYGFKIMNSVWDSQYKLDNVKHKSKKEFV